MDIQASRLPVLAGEGEDILDHALVVYIVCLTVGVILMVLSILCMFLILMNAAYKVRKILFLEYL